eukprot:m.148442 g.148442  ORF g.148442 m.148442 type:complete len:72 (-) comp14179_c0_seq1:173-388(-)
MPSDCLDMLISNSELVYQNHIHRAFMLPLEANCHQLQTTKTQSRQQSMQTIIPYHTSPNTSREVARIPPLK